MGGSRHNCPVLYFLSLPAEAATGAVSWQERALSSCQGEDEVVIKKLAFSSQDRVLFMAGRFGAVAGTAASNVAASVDGGRTWRALDSGEGVAQGVNQPGDSTSPAVNDIVVIPQMDVLRVEPTSESPLGGASVTLHGAGFKAFPGPHNPVGVYVGGTKCAITQIVSDNQLTCSLPRGYGVSLSVSAGLGTEGVLYRRQVASFEYWAPVLGGEMGGTNPVSVSVGGNEEINVLGRNFGYMQGDRIKNLVQVVIGESECRSAEWVSDSSLRCRIQPGGVRGASGGGSRETTSLEVKAWLAGREALPAHDRFSYLAPEVHRVRDIVLCVCARVCVCVCVCSFPRLFKPVLSCLPSNLPSLDACRCQSRLAQPGSGALNINSHDLGSNGRPVWCRC